MKRHGAHAALLCQQAALHGAQTQIALANALKVGARDRFVKPDHDFALFDHLALAHQHLFDNATGQVLHRLALGVDGHHALARHPFIERCQRCPQQETAKTHTQRPKTHAGGAPRIRQRG